MGFSHETSIFRGVYHPLGSEGLLILLGHHRRAALSGSGHSAPASGAMAFHGKTMGKPWEKWVNRSQVGEFSMATLGWGDVK